MKEYRNGAASGGAKEVRFWISFENSTDTNYGWITHMSGLIKRGKDDFSFFRLGNWPKD